MFIFPAALRARKRSFTEFCSRFGDFARNPLWQPETAAIDLAISAAHARHNGWRCPRVIRLQGAHVRVNVAASTSCEVCKVNCGPTNCSRLTEARKEMA